MNDERPPEAADAADANAVAQQEAISEVHEYLHVREQRRRIFPRAALVGLLAGLLAVAFRTSLGLADNLRNLLISWAQAFSPAGVIVPVVYSLVGATLSVLMVRRFAPETAGSGIPHLEAVLHRYRELDWKRVLPVKFVGGTLAIGSGLALGREGPTVQMGGAVGDAIARWMGVTTRERMTLIAAGAGAGLAAAFNAPLAGVMFVLEEVQRDFRPVVFGAAFIASAIANIIARVLSGQAPVFNVPSYPVLALLTLPVFVVLGIVAGFSGAAFNHALIAALNGFARIPRRFVLIAAAGVGAATGLVAWFAPIAVGGGHALTEQVLGGNIALATIGLWFVLRFALTTAGYATGAPGGIFTPLLALGAMVGLVVGDAAALAAPSIITQPEVFAVVGMAAYFTAVVRAPLTGIVLILEMTGDYNQMLPLLVACFCAYVVAEFLGTLPIYEALLERDLLRGGIAMHPKESIVLELEVQPHSPFEGKQIRELGLPPGCIVVHCRDGQREWIPTAATRLEAHQRITAVIAPNAPNAVTLLREGCEPLE